LNNFVEGTDLTGTLYAPEFINPENTNQTNN